MNRTIMSVYGNYGELEINEGGWVIPGPTVYDTHKIIRFNLPEWKWYWDTVALKNRFDINDLGYWHDCRGQILYEPPIDDWREFRRDGEDFGLSSIPTLLECARDVVIGLGKQEADARGRKSICEKVRRLETIVRREERPRRRAIEHEDRLKRAEM